MSLGVSVGLMIVLIIVITSIVYLIMQAEKRHKRQQLASKKAEAEANRASWERWRKR